MAGATEIQERLSEFFAAVLNVDAVELDDDFFALGGHSLTAGRLTSRIKRELGVRVTLSEFFVEPTVRGLTNLVVVGQQQVSAPGAGGSDAGATGRRQ